MAKICIDIGNTRTKIARFEEAEIVDYFFFNNDDIELEKIIFTPKDSIVVCSVFQDSTRFMHYLQNNDNVTFLSSKTKFPIDIDYDTTSTLGLDRIMAACGANTIFPGKNNLIINCGTCITIDLLVIPSRFLGGNISPGMKMRARALDEFTAKLPLVYFADLNNSDEILGKSTIQAIELGILQGIAFEITGYFNSLSKKYPDLNVVITGGDSDYLVNRLNFKTFVDPFLVLRGMNQIEIKR